MFSPIRCWHKGQQSSRGQQLLYCAQPYKMFRSLILLQPLKDDITWPSEIQRNTIWCEVPLQTPRNLKKHTSALFAKNQQNHKDLGKVIFCDEFFHSVQHLAVWWLHWHLERPISLSISCQIWHLGEDCWWSECFCKFGNKADSSLWRTYEYNNI